MNVNNLLGLKLNLVEFEHNEFNLGTDFVS